MQPDPPELPPALVTFLLGDCGYSAEVVTRCLLELADEGVLRFEPDAGGIPTISLSADSPQSGRDLLSFEYVVLERVRTRAVGRPYFPLPVLISDDGDAYKEWRRELTYALGKQAEQASLAKHSAPKISWWLCLALAAVLAGAAFATHQVHPKAWGAVAGIGAFVSFCSLAIPSAMTRWRLTPQGAAAADYWRRHGGVPASGIPRDLPPEDVRLARSALEAGIGPGSAPLPRGHAWSSLGGQWHPVRVGPVLRPLRWSTRAAFSNVITGTAVLTIFVTAPIGLIYFFKEGKLEGNPLDILIAITPLILGGAVLLRFWRPAYRRCMRLPESVTFTGEVVRHWMVKGSDNPDTYYVSIDDGASPRTLTFGVNVAQYYRVEIGKLVHVTYNQRQGRVLDVMTAADQRQPPSSASTGAPSLPHVHGS
jgi:hypothetical protein